MRTNEVVNGERGQWGKPLAGLRILAAEQMQALPYATQLLAFLGEKPEVLLNGSVVQFCALWSATASGAVVQKFKDGGAHKLFYNN